MKDDDQRDSDTIIYEVEDVSFIQQSELNDTDKGKTSNVRLLDEGSNLPVSEKDDYKESEINVDIEMDREEKQST